MRTAIVFVSAAVLALGCKDKPKAQTVTTGSAGSQAATTGSAGSGSAPANPEAPNVLKLPKRTNTPPVKTTATGTRANWDKLAALDYSGFKKDVRNIADNGVDVRYTTEARPKLAVTVTANPCLDCPPMELEKWKPKLESLKMLLAPELRGEPDTIFELGATDLAGQPVIFTYQLGYKTGPDEQGQATFAYSHAYALYYNDGINSMRVVAEYKDDPTSKREDLVALAPREDLERIAKAFLDAFTHTWQ